MRLILASRSPRRQEALAAMGLPFAIVASDAEQAPAAAGFTQPVDPTDPVPFAMAKAQDVARRHPGAVVLAGDTIVALEGDALGKPGEPAVAQAMLRRLRGKTHVVRTGLALLYLVRRQAGLEACPPEVGAPRKDVDGPLGPLVPDHVLETAEVASAVTMRTYQDAEIERYVANGEPLDCAGAYDVHRQGGALVAEVGGCFSAVVGLPIVEAGRLLGRAGIPLPRDPAAVCSRLYGRPCLASTPWAAKACLGRGLGG